MRFVCNLIIGTCDMSQTRSTFTELSDNTHRGVAMPKALERQLKREAAKKGFSKERTNAYTYGALRKTGWRPSRERRKGR